MTKRQQVLRVEDADDVVERLVVHGKRACSELRTRSTTSLHGVVSSMPTMSTRGTITSRTSVSPSEKTPCSSASSSRETSASAATTCRNCSAGLLALLGALAPSSAAGRNRSNSASSATPRRSTGESSDLQRAHDRREHEAMRGRRGEADRPRATPSTSMTIASAATTARARAPRRRRPVNVERRAIAAPATRCASTRVSASARCACSRRRSTPDDGRRLARARVAAEQRSVRRGRERRRATTAPRPTTSADAVHAAPAARAATAPAASTCGDSIARRRPPDDRVRRRAARRARRAAAAPRGRCDRARARSAARRRARCRCRRSTARRGRRARSRTRSRPSVRDGRGAPVQRGDAAVGHERDGQRRVAHALGAQHALGDARRRGSRATGIRTPSVATSTTRLIPRGLASTATARRVLDAGVIHPAEHAGELALHDARAVAA